MKSRYYGLEGKTPIELENIEDWVREFRKFDRIVAKTSVGKSEVSTVFLGIDHRFTGEGPPLLFETLVFGGPLADRMERYSTWAEAVAGHDRMVRRVRESRGRRGSLKVTLTVEKD